MVIPILALLVSQGGDIAPTATLKLPAVIHAGQVTKIALKLHFAEGLHGYQNPPSDDTEIPVKVTVVSGAKIVSISYPKGTSYKMGDSPAVKVYSGDVTVNLSVKAPQKSGLVVFSVSYQQCTDANCFPPETLTVKQKLSVRK